ncbi:PKD domain-containing protein [Micromonospora sp. WMMD714]|uniref:PKD domain-containing protein n=1 Tax=Micromonospora sp. WMMD714 TaxID=3016097 RepID=UPI00249B5987|nr:PKD domain-containing protein [Micromonospora sp. WMMD714]WFE65010.1 PKD domain-containing protein [Micromonospora sp. WMMD714]
MIKPAVLRLSLVLAILTALVGVRPTAAFAQPANDEFASATTVGSLPFQTTQDTSSATTDPADPGECGEYQSVWFTFTPTKDTLIQASTLGSDYSTVLSAWSGPSGSLDLVACNESYGDADSRITFTATAGTTYHFMVTSYFEAEAGELAFSLRRTNRPKNDSFAAAKVIDKLPFSRAVDLDTASMEVGEPTACLDAKQTRWYSYTPAVTRSITASAGYWGSVAGYSGTSLTNLTLLGCSYRYNVPFTFRAEAGTTYLFQVDLRCCPTEPSTGPAELDVHVTPNPNADFSYSPTDPSTLDTVSFHDYSFDPGRVEFASRLWKFGDGTTFEGLSPTHQYAADGDYQVSLTVTTLDGRKGKTTKVVPVRIHDGAVTRPAVPATSRQDSRSRSKAQ